MVKSPWRTLLPKLPPLLRLIHYPKQQLAGHHDLHQLLGSLPSSRTISVLGKTLSLPVCQYRRPRQLLYFTYWSSFHFRETTYLPSSAKAIALGMTYYPNPWDLPHRNNFNPRKLFRSMKWDLKSTWPKVPSSGRSHPQLPQESVISSEARSPPQTPRT